MVVLNTKKFHSDGSDEYRLFWRFLKSKTSMFSTFVGIDAPVMVRGAISEYFVGTIIFPEGKQKSRNKP